MTNKFSCFLSEQIFTRTIRLIIHVHGLTDGSSHDDVSFLGTERGRISKTGIICYRRRQVNLNDTLRKWKHSNVNNCSNPLFLMHT